MSLIMIKPFSVLGFSVPIFERLEGGRDSSYVIKSNGELVVSGSNQFGQLGTNTNFTTANGNVRVVSISGIQKVAGGRYHVLALAGNGLLYSAGYNRYGQCGVTEALGGADGFFQWTQVNLADVSSIACGDFSSYMVLNNGDMYACGQNTLSQLGNGLTDNLSVPTLIMSGVKKVSAGQHHTLILKTDGTLLACGYNRHGQCGTDTNINSNTPILTPVTVDTDVDECAAGSNHSLWIKAGVLYSCGHNYYGQCGTVTNNLTNIPNPTAVNTGIPCVYVAAGSSHTVVLQDDGVARGFGYGLQYQLAGTNDKVCSIRTLMSGIKTLTCGSRHTLLMTQDNTVYTSGQNNFRQLYNPDTPPVFTAVTV